MGWVTKVWGNWSPWKKWNVPGMEKYETTFLLVIKPAEITDIEEIKNLCRQFAAEVEVSLDIHGIENVEEEPHDKYKDGKSLLVRGYKERKITAVDPWQYEFFDHPIVMESAE